MGADARKSKVQGDMDLEIGPQIEEILEDQMASLESRFRTQIEEKALHWVEEECKKRIETLRESIRGEIQREVDNWIEGELKRRMEEFKKRNEKI